MIIDFHAHLYTRDWLPEKFWKGMFNRAVAVRKRSGEEVSPEASEREEPEPLKKWPGGGADEGRSENQALAGD